MDLKINKLRGRMGELHMSLAELSRRSGVCRYELGFILNGERKPRIATIHKICEALHIESKKITFYFPHYVPETETKQEGEV